MGQNIFRAKMKARILKMRERQNKQTPAGKVEATQIAATVAVITVVFLILKYVIISQDINLNSSPLMIFDEEYQSAANNISPTSIIFMVGICAIMLTIFIGNNQAITYQNILKIREKFLNPIHIFFKTHLNIEHNKPIIIILKLVIIFSLLFYPVCELVFVYKTHNVYWLLPVIAVIIIATNLKIVSNWFLNFIIILINISPIYCLIYNLFPLELPSSIFWIFIIVIILFILHFLLYYKHLMTRLAFFNVLFIGLTFITILIMALFINEEPKQNQYIMHYYDEKDIRRNMIISKDNYFQTADKVIIFDKNNENKTIYIPKGRVLMYEKNKIKND